MGFIFVLAVCVVFCAASSQDDQNGLEAFQGDSLAESVASRTYKLLKKLAGGNQLNCTQLQEDKLNLLQSTSHATFTSVIILCLLISHKIFKLAKQIHEHGIISLLRTVRGA